MAESFQSILGIRFFTGDLDGLLPLVMQGGLITVPSAAVLTDLTASRAHREAMESSDLAMTDSGFMVLLWWLFRGKRFMRISGLRFLRALLQRPELHEPGATFWIMPSVEDAQANRAWLKTVGITVTEENCYIAPFYPKEHVEDAQLVALLEARRPRFIFINLGGGVQERLGFYLRRNLTAFSSGQNGPESAEPRKLGAGAPAIICTGAAIAFLSGRQANIPPWADRFMLGWFMRILQNPARFIPRYWRALRLVLLLGRYGERPVAGN